MTREFVPAVRMLKGFAESSIRLPNTIRTIALLTSLAAIGQFSSNVYTPSLPFVAIDLQVSTAQAQLTYAVFLAAFAFGQLLYGPVADAWGRRPALSIGIVLFLAGTLGCAVAWSLESLIIARVVQALGAAGGLVISRAATRDSFEGEELRQVVAAITIAFAVVPGLTPILGGAMQYLFGWRSIFWLTLVCGCLVAVFAQVFLSETLPKTKPLRTNQVLSSYQIILLDRVFLIYCLVIGGVFGAMSAFFSGSPKLFIELMAVGPAEFGLYPLFAVSGFVAGGLLVRRLANRVSSYAATAIGLLIMICAVTMMAIGLWLGFVNKYFVTGCITLNVCGMGVLLPTAISSALQRFPDRAGSAASIQGFMQMMGGACGALLVSMAQPYMPTIVVPFSMATMLALAAVAFARLNSKVGDLR